MLLIVLSAPVAVEGVEVGGLSDAVLFTGQLNATSSTPPVGTNGVFWWVGGTGFYKYAAGSTVPCVQLYSDPDVPASIELPTNTGCTLDLGTGSFTSIVCGTGNASGSSGSLVETGLDPDTTTSISYTLTFIAGIGVLTGTGTESDSGAATLTGVMLMTPEIPLGTPSLTGPCTAGFNLVGALVVGEPVTAP